MKILLPPSEKKNEPEKLKALKLNALSFQADLTTTRTALLKKHKEVDISHCDVASNIYSGVLYNALDYTSLSTAAQARANSSIVIISAAFGAIRLNDVIPYYKFKIDPATWKKPLSLALHGLDNELEYDDTNFVDNIKQYLLDLSEYEKPEELTNLDIYKIFLRTIIPKIRVLFSLVKKYIKGRLSLVDVVNYLEPFLIYPIDFYTHSKNPWVLMQQHHI